uniref:Uncharacterized protein n=1 Tax=Salix viminalis TaxID=40686 RepID=A0A6N2L463_SALVM
MSLYVWSNDTYESVEYKVVVSTEKERFSIPVLLHNPATYQRYNWGNLQRSKGRSSKVTQDPSWVLSG